MTRAAAGSVDLTGLDVRGLLRLSRAVLAELRRRGLVRTENSPLADIAEKLVLRARGGVWEPNSTKSHDITTDDGCRIQVKAMGPRSSGTAGKFSVFRSVDFDSAVFVIFDGEFDIAEAYEAAPSLIAERVSFSTHVNGRAPTLQQVRGFAADVTDEMRNAYAALEAEDRP